MIKKLIIGIIGTMLLFFSSINNFRELVFEKLEKYTKSYPEKLYIQTDKPYYTIGDDIWYTAYLVNGVTHKKSNKSSILYVELIDEKNNIIDKKQLYTDDISVAGDFKITKNLKAGNYIIRAYTNYMRNKNGDYFFQKEIPIWNLKDSINNHNTGKTLKTSPNKNSQLTYKPIINFFPEGGNLITNLNCKVVIKATDKNNRSISIQGVIKDSDDKEICDFKTTDFGLENILITPQPEKTYYASVLIDGQEVKYILPKALPNGHKLSIINHGKEIILNVTSNTPTGLKNTFLVGHERGKLIFEKLETKGIYEYTVKFKTNLLSDGVANFTLFDSNGRPVCERLVFIDNPENDVSVNLHLNEELPKTRSKINLQLSLKDKDSLPLTGNLSMSITDIDAIGQSTKSENIKTYLLLNSDLRGSIENPGYFFEKNNDIKRRYYLDLILLSHGWRRFTWTDLLYKDTDIDHYKPETSIYISGITKELKGKKQKISAATRITFMGMPPYQEKKQSNQNGAFKYGPFIFNDSIPVLLEARVKDFKSDEDKKNRFVSIYLDEPYAYSPEIIRNVTKKSFLNDSTKITNFLEQSRKKTAIDSFYLRKATLLDEVIITARKKAEKEKRNEAFNERTLYGSPSNRIDMADFENQRMLSIFDLLNMIPGVTAYNDSVSIRNQGTPRIMVDGIPVEIDNISFMTGNDVDFIDVLKGADAGIFSNSANGVIAIYTRTGMFDQNIYLKRKPGIIDFTAKGFYTAREFYAPDYDDEFEEATKQDIRTTLHWEPKIVFTGDKNKTEISFFTSDIKSNYAIKIEGITNSGTPIYYLTTLEVD
jgi:hypothetical protein